jgi:hypothetical protein
MLRGVYSTGNRNRINAVSRGRLQFTLAPETNPGRYYLIDFKHIIRAAHRPAAAAMTCRFRMPGCLRRLRASAAGHLVHVTLVQYTPRGIGGTISLYPDNTSERQ